MEIASSIITLIIILIIGGLCYTIFKKGQLPKKIRDMQLRYYVDQIVTDYGDLGNNELIGISHMRLLKCRKGVHTFFVLETSQRVAFEPNTFWTPIDEPMAQKLMSLLSV